MKKKLKNEKYGVSYCRVSTDEQYKNTDGSIKSDASPLSQQQRCEDFMNYKSNSPTEPNYKFVEHLKDLGFSGKDTNRPSYQRMWNLITTEKIDFIVSTELSRISRSVEDFLKLINHCEKHNVEVFILGLDFDTSTAFGKFMVTMLVNLAQFERETTSHRVKENAKMRLIKDGKINGAAEILGLIRDTKNRGHFIKCPKETLQLERILNLFLKHSSKKEVLNFAKETGVMGRKGKPLKMAELTTILENTKWRYRGLWRVNEENKEIPIEHLPESEQYQQVKLPHGAILPLELLDKVASKLADTYDKKKRSGKGHTYMLSHILEFEDGSKFRGESAKSGQHRYYRNKKNGISIPIKSLDDVIFERVKLYIKNSRQFERLLRKSMEIQSEKLPVVKSHISSIEIQLKKLDQHEKSLQEKLIQDSDGGTTFMSWLEKSVQKLESDRQKLKRELELQNREYKKICDDSGLSKIAEKMKQMVNGADKLSGTQKRRLAEQIFKKIVVKKGNQLELHIYGEPPTDGARHNWRNKSLDSEVNGRGWKTRTSGPPVMSRML